MTSPSSPGDLVVRVDRALCVGSGICTGIATEDLARGADGRAEPLRAVSTALAELTEAAELCPMEALTVRRADSGELIAPKW